MNGIGLTNILLMVDIVITAIALGLTIAEAIRKDRKRREDDFPFPPTKN